MAHPKLLDDVAEKEAKTLEAKLAATSRVNAIEARVQDAIERAARTQRGHVQAEREQHAANERAIKEAEAKARKAVCDAEQRRRSAQLAAQLAEEQASRALVEMRIAEEALEALTPCVEKVIEFVDRGASQSACMSEKVKDAVSRDTDLRRNEFQKHLTEFHADVSQRHEQLERESQDQISQAKERAESRTRFRELCGLTRVRDHMLHEAPHHYGNSSHAQNLMLRTVDEWKLHPGRQWPWCHHEGTLADAAAGNEAQSQLEGDKGNDLLASSMRYHPVCLGIPWMPSAEPAAQPGPGRQVLTEKHVRAPLRPKPLPFGGHVSRFEGFGTFGAVSPQRKGLSLSARG